MSNDQDPFAANPYAAPSTASMEGAQPMSGAGAALATRGERFAGAFIDGLIMLPFAFGAGLVMGIMLVAMGIDPSGVAFNVISAILAALISGTIFLGINGYLLATKGQTVGKLVMKTRIVSDADGNILPLGPLVLKRYLPLWVVTSLPFVGGLFGLANALAIFRENRKCIHDDLAGTKVIKLSA